MDKKELRELSRRGLALLRLSADEWEIIEDTRLRGTRVSLTFPHEVARSGRRQSLVLIAIEGDSQTLRLGWVRSVQAIATFDSRVVFDLVRPIQPSSLAELLAPLERTTLRLAAVALLTDDQRYRRISTKLGERLITDIAAIPENAPAFRLILAQMNKPARFSNVRALQQDAVDLALKTFGVVDGATSIVLPGGDSALAAVRLQEDAVIEHDARTIPEWHLAKSDITGRALFEKRGEQLEVITANKRPLEQLLGVDLIYFNHTQNSLVMVQYKMMEPEKRKTRKITVGRYTFEEPEEQEWQVPVDSQFRDELARMHQFDKDLAPDGPYRLNSGAFFIKLVRRNASTSVASILLSLGHLTQLIDQGGLRGSRNGLRISYRELAGHYLRADPFTDLVRSGYIGTRGATTEHFGTLIDTALKGRTRSRCRHSDRNARAIG
ncbi:hypothetical protein [Oricola sp.]|uniref:hypothetical protein n=1 Tax=Oricola sp. TaxID=1979950 RepID=UPI003513F1C3